MPEKLLIGVWPNVFPTSPHTIGMRIISLGKGKPEMENTVTPMTSFAP